MALPFGHVDGSLEAVHLVGGQHLRQVFAQDRRLEQFRRVLVEEAVELEEAVEGAYAAQDAALRPWMDADVVEGGGKVLQVGECHV